MGTTPRPFLVPRSSPPFRQGWVSDSPGPYWGFLLAGRHPPVVPPTVQVPVPVSEPLALRWGGRISSLEWSGTPPPRPSLRRRETSRREGEGGEVGRSTGVREDFTTEEGLGGVTSVVGG